MHRVWVLDTPAPSRDRLGINLRTLSTNTGEKTMKLDGYVVIDKDGCHLYEAEEKEDCNNHINEACEYNLGAGKWKIRGYVLEEKAKRMDTLLKRAQDFCGRLDDKGDMLCPTLHRAIAEELTKK